MTTSANVLADYDRWLRAVASRIGSANDYDDLVQEGRIAMWRALETYDESLGSLPTWLTGAARQRMRDVAWGRGQNYGHEANRGKAEVDSSPILDGMEPEDQDALMGYVEEAYHDGSLLELVRSLPQEQREYVFLRFWGGLDPMSRAPGTRALVALFPILADRRNWTLAREALRSSLQEAS